MPHQVFNVAAKLFLQKDSNEAFRKYYRIIKSLVSYTMRANEMNLLR
jgi:hypothetical protein